MYFVESVFFAESRLNAVAYAVAVDAAASAIAVDVIVVEELPTAVRVFDLIAAAAVIVAAESINRQCKYSLLLTCYSYLEFGGINNQYINLNNID